MKEIFRFKTLVAYQKALLLIKEVYHLMEKFPSKEQYALCDQLRRSSVSVTSNIAEGSSRHSVKEQIHYLEIAYGSLLEVDSQLEVAWILNYITEADFSKTEDLIEEVAKCISGLQRSKAKQDSTL